MSVIDKLATSLDTKSDVPNKVLAKELIEKNDNSGINTIIDNLKNKNKSIQSDCVKVLYEIGYIKPDLISGYVNIFVKLLKNRNNRLVWGGMIALSTIANLKAEEIFRQIDEIKYAIENGSVITVDAGIKTVSRVAASADKYNKALFPYLIKQLKACRPKSVAQYSESIFVVVTEKNKKQFVEALQERKDILNQSQLKRIDKLLKALENA